MIFFKNLCKLCKAGLTKDGEAAAKAKQAVRKGMNDLQTALARLTGYNKALAKIHGALAKVHINKSQKDLMDSADRMNRGDYKGTVNKTRSGLNHAAKAKQHINKMNKYKDM